MSKVPMVEINTDYVSQFMAANAISGSEFSQSLGYSDNWWSGIFHHTKQVKPNVAKLMCTMYQMDYDKLVSKKTPYQPIPEAVSLNVDAEVVEVFGKRLERIESKLDKLLVEWCES